MGSETVMRPNRRWRPPGAAQYLSAVRYFLWCVRCLSRLGSGRRHCRLRPTFESNSGSSGEHIALPYGFAASGGNATGVMRTSLRSRPGFHGRRLPANRCGCAHSMIPGVSRPLQSERIQHSVSRNCNLLVAIHVIGDIGYSPIRNSANRGWWRDALSLLNSFVRAACYP